MNQRQSIIVTEHKLFVIVPFPKESCARGIWDLDVDAFAQESMEILAKTKGELISFELTQFRIPCAQDFSISGSDGYYPKETFDGFGIEFVPTAYYYEWMCKIGT